MSTGWHFKTILQLQCFCLKYNRWNEIPYVQAFVQILYHRKCSRTNRMTFLVPEPPFVSQWDVGRSDLPDDTGRSLPSPPYNLQGNKSGSFVSYRRQTVLSTETRNPTKR